MEKCLKMLEGKHDFSAFRATGGPDVSPVRNIFSAKLKISDREKLPYENGYWNNTDNGKIIEMRFFADGFLYHQVRNMVGTLANVGMGRTSAEKFKEILSQKGPYVITIEISQKENVFPMVAPGASNTDMIFK